MRFTKMHGAGNDYVYVNGFDERVEDPAALAVQMSRAHFGVGADGLILVLPSERADFRMRMFNSDGSEGKMCGNGARCVGRFVHDKGLTDKTEFTLESGGAVYTIRLHCEDDQVRAVTVGMGMPQGWQEEGIWTRVAMGSPHAVQVVADDPFAWAAFAEQASPVCAQMDANIEYVQILAPDRLRMRVFERGSGETLACGSGACATAAAVYRKGLCGPRVSVQMRGGTLEIALGGEEGVWMTGEAVPVFEGEWLLK